MLKLKKELKKLTFIVLYYNKVIILLIKYNMGNNNTTSLKHSTSPKVSETNFKVSETTLNVSKTTLEIISKCTLKKWIYNYLFIWNSRNFSSLKYNKKWQVISWKIKEKDSCNKIIFFNWYESKPLIIDWIEDFQSFSLFNYNEEWRLISWVVQNENWDYYSFNFEWDEYIKTKKN